MIKYTKIGLLGSAVAVLSVAACTTTDTGMYGSFPITVKNYSGTSTNSVSYTGQIARHTLHESLKKLAGKGNGKSNPGLKAKMMSYYAGKDAGRSILAPTGNSSFPVMQSGVDQISKKKNLAGKTYKGTISGMPNQMTGPDLVKFWIGKASSAKKARTKLMAMIILS